MQGLIFSIAEAVKRNVEACLLADVPLIEGTTGWNNQREEIEKNCQGKERRVCLRRELLDWREFVLSHHRFRRRIVR